MADLVPDQLEQIASRRIGPAPLGVWIGGAAALAIIGAAILRRRRTGSASIPDAPTEPVGDETSSAKPRLGQTIPAQFVAGGSSTGTSNGSGVADPFGFTPPALQTNADWRRRAEIWAIGNGYPALIASQAVSRFLGAEPLNAQERAIIEAVLRAVGPTPEPVPPPLDIPGPIPPASPNQPPTSPVTPPPAPTAPVVRLNEHRATVAFWQRNSPIFSESTAWLPTKAQATAAANVLVAKYPSHQPTIWYATR